MFINTGLFWKPVPRVCKPKLTNLMVSPLPYIFFMQYVYLLSLIFFHYQSQKQKAMFFILHSFLRSCLSEYFESHVEQTLRIEIMSLRAERTN